MKDKFNLLMSAILAGICISIGCIVNLKVGGLLGPILFTFGLLTVVHYKYSLYTGTAGFVSSWEDIKNLFAYTLLGNLIGCAFTAIAASYALPELLNADTAIIHQRESQEWYSALIRGIFCGFLMTTAVKFGRENRFLPLLFAVPVFILSGFYHSIADYFYLVYYNFTADEGSKMSFVNWIVTVGGNFIGCNLYRIRKE